MRLVLSLVFAGIVFALSPATLAQPSQEKAVVAQPGYARFVMTQADTPKVTVTVYSNEAAAFKVLAVTSPVNWIKVKFSEAKPSDRSEKGAAGNAQYRVEISVDGGSATVGPIAQFVTIKTNSPTMTELRLPISGFVRQPPSDASITRNATEGRLIGTVVDAAGSALADVKVVISDKEGKVPDILKTSLANGMFNALILDASRQYKIRLEKPGYAPVEQDVQLKTGDTVRTTYTLTPMR